MKKILVIEDNKDNFELMRQILADEDYRVAHAEIAEHGIQQLYNKDVDLVLMDLSLPDMDGFEAIKLIRSIPDMKDVRIVVVTAHAQIANEEAAMKAGCNAYLTKPIDEDLFLQTIREQLG